MDESSTRAEEKKVSETRKHLNDKKNILAYFVFVLAAACAVMSVLFVYVSSYNGDNFDIRSEVREWSSSAEDQVQQIVYDFYDFKYQELGNKYYIMELRNSLGSDSDLKDTLDAGMLDCRVTVWAEDQTGALTDQNLGLDKIVLYNTMGDREEYDYSYTNTGEVTVKRLAYKGRYESFEAAETAYAQSEYYNDEAYGYNIYPVDMDEDLYSDTGFDEEGFNVTGYSDGDTDTADTVPTTDESTSETFTSEDGDFAEDINTEVVLEEENDMTNSIDSTESYNVLNQYELEIYYFVPINIQTETGLNVAPETMISSSYPYYISNTGRFNKINKLSLVTTLLSIICMLISAVVIVLRTVRYSRYSRTGERIPAEIYYAEMACGILIIAAAYCYIGYNYGWFHILAKWPARYIVTLIAGFGIAVAFIAFISMMSLQLLVKNYCNGVVAEHSIIVRLFGWIKKLFKAIGQFLRYIGERITFITKAILFYGILTVAEIITLAVICNIVYGAWVIIALYVIIKLVGIVIFITSAVELYELYKGGILLAEGETDHRINTKYMFWLFKKHGENLNKIQDGIENAVEDKMKSERMKTELITNVSHDIKTPLTSIINYTDLLDKQNIQDETARDYINVLKRQSLRLKKLIEDLVEASKASTGNLEVNKELMDANLLLNQAVAEYDDRLAKSGLELVVTNSDTPAYIVADGRHLWRVFDNMLGNICKYAMPHTRVYVDVIKTEKNVKITFKNISRDKLNISADELMERFVRGDQSRNTEGSGLGLSIAKSLCEIMDGRFKIDIDGDLYKASVIFNVETADESDMIR